jgi:hypothetical protein
MGSLLLTCAATWLSLIAVWYLRGATPRGRLWTLALTLPHVHDRLRVRLMAMLCPCCRPSMRCHMHRQLMRNELARLHHYHTHNGLLPKK